MDAEIAHWKQKYPNLDQLMIETILKMSDEQHQRFQAGLASDEKGPEPEKFIYEDAIQLSSPEIAEPDVSESQTKDEA